MLPVEILRHIFEYIQTSHTSLDICSRTRRPYVLILGSVCASWRRACTELVIWRYYPWGGLTDPVFLRAAERVEKIRSWAVLDLPDADLASDDVELSGGMPSGDDGGDEFLEWGGWESETGVEGVEGVDEDNDDDDAANVGSRGFGSRPPLPPISSFPPSMQRVYAALPKPPNIQELIVGPRHGALLAQMAGYFSNLTRVIVKSHSSSWGITALDHLTTYTTTLTYLKVSWDIWTGADNVPASLPELLMRAIHRLISSNPDIRRLRLLGDLSPVSDVNLDDISAALPELEMLNLCSIWKVQGDVSAFRNLTELYLSIQSPPTGEESIVVQLLRAIPDKRLLKSLGTAGARESRRWTLDAALLLQFENLTKYFIDTTYWSPTIQHALPHLAHLQALGLILDTYRGPIASTLLNDCSKLRFLVISTETLYRVKLVRSSNTTDADAPVEDVWPPSHSSTTTTGSDSSPSSRGSTTDSLSSAGDVDWRMEAKALVEGMERGRSAKVVFESRSEMLIDFLVELRC
ncbi:hypothetical protein HK104_011224 [Borealophlyctis nickersoniae]|nr:hypothetical protein HK104_011224 [Borealophlyctis nickersoniae]